MHALDTADSCWCCGRWGRHILSGNDLPGSRNRTSGERMPKVARTCRLLSESRVRALRMIAYGQDRKACCGWIFFIFGVLMLHYADEYSLRRAMWIFCAVSVWKIGHILRRIDVIIWSKIIRYRGNALYYSFTISNYKHFLIQNYICVWIIIASLNMMHFDKFVTNRSCLCEQFKGVVFFVHLRKKTIIYL